MQRQAGLVLKTCVKVDNEGARQPLRNAEKAMSHTWPTYISKAVMVVSRSCSATTWSVGKAKFNISRSMGREREKDPETTWKQLHFKM